MWQCCGNAEPPSLCRGPAHWSLNWWRRVAAGPQGANRPIVLLGLSQGRGSDLPRLDCPTPAWVNSPAHTNAAPPAFARVTWTQQNSPACNGHDSKRQMFGDFAQDVCLIYGHQEGGCYLFPGTTSHPKPVRRLEVRYRTTTPHLKSCAATATSCCSAGPQPVSAQPTDRGVGFGRLFVG